MITRLQQHLPGDNELSADLETNKSTIWEWGHMGMVDLYYSRQLVPFADSEEVYLVFVMEIGFLKK